MPAKTLSPRCVERTSKFNNISVKCRYCKSENVVKRGWYKTKNRGKQQRWLCRECGKGFTMDLGFWKMKNKENLITMAIDNYFENLSSRAVQRNLYKYHITNVSYRTILNWVKKYSKKLSSFTRRLKPKLSGEFYVDETEIRCKKQQGIFWAGIDGNTKYLVTSLYTMKPQNTNDAKKVIQKLKDTKQTVLIQTDSRGQYPPAIKKLFGKGKKGLSIKYNQLNVYKTGKHNVKIERFFRSLKERTRLMYWFKSFNNAKWVLEGYTIWYNFIRYHMTLNKTPAEASGLNLGLGMNKLGGIIILSGIIEN